ncbi:MAG TPA: phosphoglycerate mutase family protein [Luteimonas sp.]|nr:phosphoglycerate mutase family protein [Luteimonas sp.]
MTFVVVRHGEKTSDTEHDPELSAAGLERAQALARQLADDDLVAVYTSDYRRTRQTAQPSAAAHRLEAVVYDAKLPADEFARQLKAAHRHGTVLVAGHSNTVPGIVTALCACEVEAMPDSEYDRLSTIHVDADGRARLVVGRYGASSPSLLPLPSP